MTDGAGNEVRTRDPNHGKVMLYQLSYSRTPCGFLSGPLHFVWSGKRGSNSRP